MVHQPLLRPPRLLESSPRPHLHTHILTGEYLQTFVHIAVPTKHIYTSPKTRHSPRPPPGFPEYAPSPQAGAEEPPFLEMNCEVTPTSKAANTGEWSLVTMSSVQPREGTNRPHSDDHMLHHCTDVLGK